MISSDLTMSTLSGGGPDTLIGVNADDQLRFVTNPASLSLSVLTLDGTNVTYRIDGKLSSTSDVYNRGIVMIAVKYC